MNSSQHEKWMKLALVEAQRALEMEEVPVGAVVVKGNHILGKGHNQCELLKDPTAHAEVIAITAAANQLSACHKFFTEMPILNFL